jgi:dTDP-4-dehydrorhamnose 3,5-epimerase
VPFVRLLSTTLPGVKRIVPEPHRDERGFFARLSCTKTFADAGSPFETVQMNLSRNTHRHSLRGMHYQNAPFAEAKIVRVVRGAMFDVIVDLRPESPTFKRWEGFTLDADAAEGLVVPEGCAHGFLTLVDDTDVLYQMGRAYVPGHARGVRWDDPAFGIEWPVAPAVIDAKDKAWPGFEA